MKRNLWTREEFILTFNQYLKMPFGKMHQANPDIIKLAKLLGRTPSSITLRLVNFASCDPYLQSRGIKGMRGGHKQCQPYWDEFANDREKLLFESEKILAEREHTSLEKKFSPILKDISGLKGATREALVSVRVNQNVFRQIVLSNYNGKCAVSGVELPELLVASHIIPWAERKEERLNPENGICLSSLYDKAFDQGLIGFDADYKMQVSQRLGDFHDRQWYEYFIHPFENHPLALPEHYKPSKVFLEWHMDTLFVR
jgi:putative restriction endonuclease